MRKPEKRQLVWVTWHDAASETTRTHSDALEGVTLATNVNLGWIIHQDDRRIVLAHGFSNTDEVDHFTIPRSCVVGIEPAAYAPRAKKAEAK